MVQIARQMDRADEAQKRILEEGLVVRDMKGSVIAHPAIQIEKDACKIITDLLHRHRWLENTKAVVKKSLITAFFNFVDTQPIVWFQPAILYLSDTIQVLTTCFYCYFL